MNTNVLIFERPATTFFHPHPEVEALRCGLAAKLRQCYQELCHSREGIHIIITVNFDLKQPQKLFDLYR